MHPEKEELSNVAGAANQKIQNAPAKMPEEKEIIDECRKAKDAQEKMEFHDGATHQDDQHNKYEYPIPTPGGEYPIRQTAAPIITGAATGPTRSRDDAMQPSRLHVHRGEHECPIPTPGGEYPMRRAATTANGSSDE